MFTRYVDGRWGGWGLGGGGRKMDMLTMLRCVKNPIIFGDKTVLAVGGWGRTSEGGKIDVGVVEIKSTFWG